MHDEIQENEKRLHEIQESEERIKRLIQEIQRGEQSEGLHELEKGCKSLLQSVQESRERTKRMIQQIQDVHQFLERARQRTAEFLIQLETESMEPETESMEPCAASMELETEPHDDEDSCPS